MTESDRPVPDTDQKTTGSVVEDLGELEEVLGKPRIGSKIKRWAKILGVVAGIVGASSTIWKGFDAVDDLHDTIIANKDGIDHMAMENEEANEHHRKSMRRIVMAVQTIRERDREVVTNLRIAVAALQAAQSVRDGRAGYDGPSSLSTVYTGRTGGSVEPVPLPRTHAARVAQSAEAQEDAAEALRRATKVQHHADQEDPLSDIPWLD